MKKVIDTEKITFDMIDAFLSKSNISEGLRAALKAAPETKETTRERSNEKRRNEENRTT